MGVKTSRDSKIRLYDSTATPLYLELDFDKEDFSGPLGPPETEEILKLNRGKMDALAHYIEGSDDKLMEPVEISFTVAVRDHAQTTNLKNWLKAMNDALATEVNSNPLESTEGDTMRDGAVANPAFADSNKSCCNVEYVVELGDTDLGVQYNEVRFPLADQSISESGDDVLFNLKGKVYGTIEFITGFTAGADVEAE